MAVKTSWSAGEVLTAADLTDTFAAKSDSAPAQNAQTGTTYTFVLADATRIVFASNAGSQTYTVPPQASVAWSTGTILSVVNIGAGVVTFAGGSGVTVNNTAATLAQWESANLVRTASNTWTVVKGGGGLPKATVSGTTGSPSTASFTDLGRTFTFYRWNGAGSFTTGNSGTAVLVLAAGGGGGGFNGGGGGGAGGCLIQELMLQANTTYSITIGGGGAGNSGNGSNTTCTASITNAIGGGGGGTGGVIGSAGGSSGGTGYNNTAAPGAPTSGQGFTGAAGQINGFGGGGGGAGGAGAVGGGAGAAKWLRAIEAPVLACSGGAGGNGATGGSAGSAAGANTGSGGNGGANAANGGAGGSGFALLLIG